MIYRNGTQEAVRALEVQRLGNHSRENSAFCCSNCEEEIYSGEDYLECENGIFCRECVDAWTAVDLMEVLGYAFKKEM